MDQQPVSVGVLTLSCGLTESQFLVWFGLQRPSRISDINEKHFFSVVFDCTRGL